MAEEPMDRPKKHGLVRRTLTGTVKRALRALAYGLVGGFIVFIVVVVMLLEGRPDLSVWHTVDLEEFTERSDVDTFDDYIAFEDRLFAEVQTEVYDVVGAMPSDNVLDRFDRGVADPARWPVDWNRTFEWESKSAACGVLLLHGMSDAPYSMRTFGERFHEAGAHVIGLRVPGHGTAPSGLRTVKWEDMAAAVRLAMIHLHEETDGAPLFMVGYSNGGALAVEYGLEAIASDELPRPEGIILMSAAIGVTRLAAIAAWQERLGHLLGLEKLSWNSIGPEINPFKYESFAINAGKQTRRLTLEIQSRMTKLERKGTLKESPRVLAFQSIVDGTVTASALIDGLFARLPDDTGNEIVAFDINRFIKIEQLLRNDPRPGLEARLVNAERGYELTLVSNESPDSRKVVAQRWNPANESVIEPLGKSWPEEIYSLSHVALPFPESDPLYGGGAAAEKSPGPQLGAITMRGERGVLKISPSFMLRQRWNPFYEYMEGRMMVFMELAEPE
jgi:alpha-beta hydrolase superfamily lysophospholipase